MWQVPRVLYEAVRAAGPPHLQTSVVRCRFMVMVRHSMILVPGEKKRKRQSWETKKLFVRGST